ncbi:hypothetical protein QBC36DRAFT_369415 [Triangularia setosa]|uniref:Uncharacterized protein n=1 Tax=Triangularia setosa TaxID=2587417 RepID=A0AAN7A8M8_9PEZI|nr:hypothetical protein QBC36DRAFT_369415 [Podospora setosa]
MLRLFLIFLAYSASTVLTAPSLFEDHPTKILTHAPKLSQGQQLNSLDGKPCTWDDTLGEAECGTFTITFGDGGIWGNKLYTTVRLPDFQKQLNLNCSNYGDAWTAVRDTPGLPYTISIHGGNGCISTDFWWEAWDNLWIKYANQWVDVASDGRCTSVFWNGKGRRCVIAIKPGDPVARPGDEVAPATVRG